ncbi:MAG TPA: hypothetical protein VGB94_08900 [Acidobacteriaceae bacterium]
MRFRSSIAIAFLAGSTLASPLPAEQPAQPANDLVRQVVDHELHSQDNTLWHYRAKTVQSGTVDLVNVVETKRVDLRHVYRRNGNPLTPDQRKSDDEVMERLISSPREQQKQQRTQEQDKRQTMDMLALLPKALLFDYAQRNGNIVKLNFHPNPAFNPPSREAHVFHEMEGQLTVDEEQKRIVEFSGHLIRSVRFGFFLGHLDQGGTFAVHQEQVAPNHWELTRLKVNMNGKALFFKTINVQQNEERSDFKQVPNTLTLSQAAELLRKSDTD